MTSQPQNPLVEEYFTDLRRRAGRLPRQQRKELLAELRAHLDDGMDAAQSDADTLNMLDALGTPKDIVDASAPPDTTGGPTGRLALASGVAALILIPTLFLALILGAVAIFLGINARKSLRSTGQPTSVATGAIAVGTLAVVVGLALTVLLAFSSL